jgi:hypothetical protein
MGYNVDMYISPVEVDRLGKDVALVRATQEAWITAIVEAKPTYSLVLRDISEHKHQYIPNAIVMRYTFEVGTKPFADATVR